MFRVTGDARAITAALNERADKKVVLDILPSRSGVGMNLNKFLWVLLDILADARNLRCETPVTARDCFVTLMDEYGTPGVVLECPRGSFKRMQNVFPSILKICNFKRDGEDMERCKIFTSAASLEDVRVSHLIDAVFDELMSLHALHDEDARYL
ncbi:MAG: hypothetical protein RR994_03765, partial [Clostridia bacterium]